MGPGQGRPYRVTPVEEPVVISKQLGSNLDSPGSKVSTDPGWWEITHDALSFSQRRIRTLDIR